MPPEDCVPVTAATSVIVQVTHSPPVPASGPTPAPSHPFTVHWASSSVPNSNGTAIPPQGHAPQGHAPQGRAPQGRAPQGRAPHGRSPQGHAPQGHAPQGMAPPQGAQEALAPQGAQEALAPIPLTPIHANQLPGPQVHIYDLPGSDHFPRLFGARAVDGHWMSGSFEDVLVGGRLFVIPLRLLQRHSFWRMMRSMERPPQGWVMPNEDPNIFAILIECVYSPSGFDGNERHINMVKLCLAIVLAKRWDMQTEVQKLEISIRRYIVRRILFRNPFLPDTERVMDHNYFVFRSEELYRTWELCQRFNGLDAIISTSELVSLYATAIPSDMWPALTSNFNQEFSSLIDITAAVRQFPAEQCFEDWWFRFFKMAGYLEYPWAATRAMNRSFVHRDHDDNVIPAHARAEFEAARARGDAIIAAYNANGQAAAQAVAAAPDAYVEALHGLANASLSVVPAGGPANVPGQPSAGGIAQADPDATPRRASSATAHGMVTPERSPPRVHFASEPEIIEIPFDEL